MIYGYQHFMASLNEDVCLHLRIENSELKQKPVSNEQVEIIANRILQPFSTIRDSVLDLDIQLKNFKPLVLLPFETEPYFRQYLFSPRANNNDSLERALALFSIIAPVHLDIDRLKYSASQEELNQILSPTFPLLANPCDDWSAQKFNELIEYLLTACQNILNEKHENGYHLCYFNEAAMNVEEQDMIDWNWIVCSLMSTNEVSEDLQDSIESYWDDMLERCAVSIPICIESLAVEDKEKINQNLLEQLYRTYLYYLRS